MPASFRTDDPTILLDDEPAAPLQSRKIRGEIIGALTVLFGIFVLACLLAGSDGQSVVGEFGQAIRELVQDILGAPVSFLVPVAILWLGVEVFLGRARRWSAGRIFGIFFTIWAITGLLALPGADTDIPEIRQATFDRAGVMGTMLVQYEGLALVGQFGTLGAALMLTGMLLVGIVMTTNVGLSSIASVVMRRSGKERRLSETAAGETPRTRSADSGGVFSRLLKGRRIYGSGATGAKILTPTDDPEGWEDLDEDVLAAARAIEVAQWEAKRAKNKIAVRSVRPDDETEPGISRVVMAKTSLVEDEIETMNDEDEWEEEAAEEDVLVGGDEEEDLEEEEEDEIVFEDHTAPLPTMNANPANSPKLGEGLAKLFPNRWPKDGTPAAAADKKESRHEELLDQAEARRMRQIADAKAGEPSDDDPLFTEAFDTRPFGPNGQPTDSLEIETSQADLFDYQLPTLELLADPPTVDARMTRDEMLEMSGTLIETLKNFGIDGKVTEVHQGPVVTRFEFRPAAGIKVSRIVGLEQDMAMSMRAISVRILAPIPGKNAVGIEVPNKKRQGVYLKELISCQEFWEPTTPLNFALGKTIDGSPYFADLAKMPHLLIAGATGAGKSVCLNTIICSLLYRRTPDEIRFIMVDPKRVELSVYADIPHLLAPVVCEPKCAAGALAWAVEQMEDRYKKLVELGVRNIDGYNRAIVSGEALKKTRGRKLKTMPYMVIVVDELADLMLVAKADVEESIQRLAQMARAVGIHLILATQRPSVNVITGIIKANFPSRIAFQVSQKVDSRTILDCNGAEALLGRGDMLFSKGGAGKPIRIQGAFLSDEEVERIADFARHQMPPNYEVEEFEAKLSEKEQRELARMMGVSNMDDLEMQDRMVRGTNKVMGKVSAGMFIPHEGGSARAGDDEIDEALVRAAARLILETRKASVSLLQRRLKVGFARAGRLMDMLEEMGIVGEFKGSKPRDIVVDPEAALLELDKLEMALNAGKSVDEIKAAEAAGEDYAAGLIPQPTGRARILEDDDEYEEEEDAYDEEEEVDEEEYGDPNEPWPDKKRA